MIDLLFVWHRGLSRGGVMLIVALILLVGGDAPGAENVTGDERIRSWQNDLEFLTKAVQRDHYLYATRPLPASFGSSAATLRSSVDRWTDEQVFAELHRLMATLGDGHCYVAPSPTTMQKMPIRQLPLRLYQFTDGLFVIDADALHQRWIGRRIMKFGSLPAEEAMRRMEEFVPRDNIHGVRWWGPGILSYRGMLERLDAIPPNEENVTLRFSEGAGAPDEATVEFVPFRRLSPPERKLGPARLPGAPPAPLHLKDVRSHFWYEALPQFNAVYCQFNQVQNSPTETIKAFAARLETRLRLERPGLLVVDVRHNDGGDSTLLDPLVKVLRDFERRDLSVKLVVIAGRGTFSAAQIFISRLDQETKAIFAGEPSSSKPNFVGEDNPVQLPWSGVIVSISNRYHASIPGDTREWIEPEIRVELSSRDYFANRDPVLDTVLARYAPSAPAGPLNPSRLPEQRSNTYERPALRVPPTAE